MKFGLIVPDSKKKLNTSNSLNVNNKQEKVQVASIFNEEDDSEEEELRALRNNKKRAEVSKSISSSDQFVSKLHEEALSEDPNIFDYDAAIDEEFDNSNSKNSHRNNRFYNVIKSTAKTQNDNKEPKYMKNILAKAEERKIELELVKLRTVKRKAANEATEPEEEVFVTSAYRQRLAELEEKEKELKERQKDEEDGDVSKRKDMSGFYYNLMKRNVSFGGKKVKAEEEKVEVAERVEKQSIQITNNNNNSITDEIASSDEEPVVFGPRRPTKK